MDTISNKAITARDYLIKKREKPAREFLSKLPLEVLVYSGLYYIDFKTASLDSILFSIYCLSKNIEALKELIDKYNIPEVKVLRISSPPTLPNAVYSDYDNKQVALRSILSNKDVLFLYNLYLAEKQEQEQEQEQTNSPARKPR